VDAELRSLMIVGGQWGDEGKGKVVDLLAGSFPAVVRSNGGHNAGHTVRFADRRFALHLVPSGVIHGGATCYLAAGMVVDPAALLTELDGLAAEGVSSAGRVFLSPRATLILPTHRALDLAREGVRGSGRIGTTGRGIGPAYADLSQRRALRAFLLSDPARLTEHARSVMEEHNRELTRLLDAEPVDVESALAGLRQAAVRLAPLLREVGPALELHAARGDRILFEGAQGVLLDLSHGTYPYVTSSSCLPAAAAVSCGVGPALLGPVLGVMKAYVTRVGGGPFPSELEGPTGDRIRDRGVEFGTTTGRPRRCGWFDAVAARYAVRVAGIDAVALMKLDVLDGFDQLQVVVAYELANGETLDTVPPDPQQLEAVRPRLETLPGWRTPTAGVTDEADLPAEAQRYLAYLEDRLGVPVVLVSTGPRREETLLRGTTRLGRQLAALVGRLA
jgi:adenylosuccinate synthase